MPLSLATITFNHDLAGATTSALNIRKNKDFETALPEFDSAIARSAQEQCAAYAIAPTRAQAVFVRFKNARVMNAGGNEAPTAACALRCTLRLHPQRGAPTRPFSRRKCHGRCPFPRGYRH